MAQSAWAKEYTDCFSAEGSDSTNECPGYDTKQSDSAAAVMLELLGVWNTYSLTSLPGSFWPEVVTLGRILTKGQIELFDV